MNDEIAQLMIKNLTEKHTQLVKAICHIQKEYIVNVNTWKELLPDKMPSNVHCSIRELDKAQTYLLRSFNYLIEESNNNTNIAISKIKKLVDH